ncbi:hypothetical protein AMAG_18482 [Allomyces macrogynus ATCC 38327]|uniref:Enhancer of polycomb-like protein n=1 Tax=Allomyces macrogynus (strain ATCC 38327) TaxID=578462 RepID=A0A0L0SCM2_ALLM3|nr:hypothetical protein AMAG_18482 [Allomyces macrogynus ATCC 38327]|eukprot:KNE60187.1 hypothetical protein AMAG_18482 [Allomyces macrogynus ATCC 38327]
MTRDSTKFRSRKLDPRRSLPVYRASQLKDLDDATTLARTLTEVATGVEKEEEKELHLQAAISLFATTGASAVHIPTPDANQTIPEGEYLRLHPRRTVVTTGVATIAAKETSPASADTYPPCLPRSLIRCSAQVEDSIGCPYNVDDEDAAWLHAFRDGFAAGKSAVLDTATAAAAASAANAAVVSPPAKKRARTKSAGTAATAAAAAAASAAAHTPSRLVLTDDLFERCMHVLEALMNDRTSWMLTTPGFEQELEQADFISVTEALPAEIHINEFERPDYVPPSRATAAAAARAKALAQAQALQQAASLAAAAHVPAALAIPNAGPATVKSSRASSTTPLEAPARASRVSQLAARAAAAAGTVRGQPLVMPASRGTATDDMPSMTELLNRRVDDEFRKRKAAEEQFEDVSLFPKQILVGMPPPAATTATATTPGPAYVPPPGVTSRSGSTAAGQIMARQQRVAAAMPTGTPTPPATPSAPATPAIAAPPVPLSASSSVASLAAGPPAATMSPAPLVPRLPPSIMYPLAWRAYAAQMLVRGYPSPYAVPPSMPTTTTTTTTSASATSADTPAMPPLATAVYSPGAWPSLPAYARFAPGHQHAWLYPYAARSAALAEARSIASRLKSAESTSQPTSPISAPTTPALRHPLVHGPAAALPFPSLPGQGTVVLPLPTPEPALETTTTTTRSLTVATMSASLTTTASPTASTPAKTLASILVTRGPPSPSSSPLSNGAAEPPADPPLLIHPSIIAAARSVSPAPPLSPASVLSEDPLADKPVALPATLPTAAPAAGPLTMTPLTPPPGIGVGPSDQLFADWLTKEQMVLDGNDASNEDGADEPMDVDGKSKDTSVAAWIMRKRVGRNGRVFLERRCAPGTRWGNV